MAGPEIVIAPAQSRAVARACAAEKRSWCYVGRHLRLENQVAHRAHPEQRLRLGAKFHAIAEDLRAPYLDLVAGLGTVRRGREWWASAFASKSPHHTDCFLLLCYRTLVGDLVRERVRDGLPLVIFVEDPWLFQDLRSDLGDCAEVRGTWLAALWRARLIALWALRGAALRCLLAIQLLASRAVLWRQARRLRSQRDLTAWHVALVSIAEQRSLKSSRFEDPYLGGLASLLQDNGAKVIRLFLPMASPGLTTRMLRLRESIWPLVLDLRFRDVGAFFACWWPRVDSTATIRGMSLERLLKRERHAEFRTAGYTRCLLTYASIARCLRTLEVGTVGYAYENQAWEKMVCLAVNERDGCRTVAHQHASVPRFQLRYFLGAGEGDAVPFPDRVVVNGPHWLRVLQSSRYPEGTLVLGGSWRYVTQRERPTPQTAREHKILVALPTDRETAERILEPVRHLAASLDQSQDWSIVVKAHPDTPVVLSPTPRLRVSREAFSDLLATSDIVVGAGTTTVEAWLARKRVIRVRPEMFFDLDPTCGAGFEDIVVTDEAGLVDAVHHQMSEVRRLSRGSVGHRGTVFSDVETDVWLREFSLATG